MVIDLYKTASPNNSLNKTLENHVSTTDAELVQYDKERDSMVITITSILNLDFNYAKVNGKYYFATPSVDAYGFSTIQLSIDPLMTYKSDILKCTAEIVRAEKNANYYIDDGFFMCDSHNKVEYVQGWSAIGTPAAYIVTTGA